MADTRLSETDDIVERGRRRSAAPRSLFGDLVQFVDFLIVIAASVVVAYAYHAFVLQAPYDYQPYAAAGIVGATGLTALLRWDGYYEYEKLLSSRGSIQAIVSRWAMVLLGLLAFAFALKISEAFSRVWLVSWSAAVIVFIVAAHAVSASILRAMSSAGGTFARRIAVVGATALAATFSRQVGAQDGLTIAGVYEAGLSGDVENDDILVEGDLNALEAAARDGRIDDIVIAAPRASKEEMARLVRRLSALPVSIAICPNVHWLDHTGGAVASIGGANVLSLYRRPLEGWGGLIKTLEDYIGAAALLVVLSPMLLAIALAIRLQGRGPIIFAQQRHGFNNAVFKIYKFRTMTVMEDGAEIRQAQKDDPRITPVGRFLRRYSLDELPQLINVVRGEMSLVGPRPHALAHNHQYARLIENYSGRHKVKPGITGWAQVNGYRGETSENELMEQRVQYDLAYIDNWSLWFDFKILVMTMVAVVFPKNAV